MSIERKKLAEDFEAIKSTLTTIVRTVAEKPDLEVINEIDEFSKLDLLRRGQDPEDAWYYSPSQIDKRTGKQTKAHVRIPEKITAHGEVSAMGKAAHEGAHVASTRFEKIAESEFPREAGFQAILHALEERPTDQLVRFRHSDYGKNLDVARRESYKEGSEAADIGGKRLKSSKMSQLCNLFVYSRFVSDPENYDPQVLKLYEELSEVVEFIENLFPNKGSSEEEIIEMQKERLRIIKGIIWPSIQGIIKEDFNLEMLQTLLKAILGGQIQIDSSKPTAGKPLCKIQLPPDLAAKLSKLTPPASSGDLTDVLTVKADPELIKAIENTLDLLPDEVKKRLEEETQKAIENAEQKIVDEHAGKLVARPQTAHERRQAIEENLKKARAEAELKDITTNISAEREQVRREQAALLEQKSAYEKIYDEVRDLEQALYRELDEVFHPKTKAKVRLKSSGARVNLGAYIKWETQRMVGKLQPIKFFESTETPHKKNYAITLLVDLSGSMYGEKIDQTIKAIVAIGEAFNRLGLHFEVLGFQDDVIVFKKFSERLSDSIRKKMSGMVDEVSGNNPNGHNTPRYNDDGPCLTEAAEGLSRQPGENKFLIVLSDGLPAGRRSDEEDLKKAVKKINTAGKVNLVALGLGQGTEHVEKYYPVSLPNIQAHELPEVLPELLKDIIKNPRKYRV